MRKIVSLILVTLLLSILVIGCSDDESTGPGNTKPDQPNIPTPEDNAIDVSLDTDLTWQCSHPNEDDLTYDVYLGTSSNPQLVSEDQTELSFNPDNLEYETTYYWKVIADDGEYQVDSEVWSFTTHSGAPGTMTDIDGNVYQTIIIGNQEWMAENLKVTHFRNGDSIPHLTNDGEWTSTSNGAYCAYDNNESNVDTYGYLYNWYAVVDERKIAPEGWHVPTDEEIKIMEMALGMSESEANDDNWRGTNEGSKLAGNASLWDNGDLENDPEFGTSGFNFLPGGYRYYYDGYFNDVVNYGYFWSSTEYNGYAWCRKLLYYSTQVNRYYNSKRSGFSVRLLRD